MKIAVCTSSHGFGHTARQLGLIERLVPRHQVTLFTHAPAMAAVPQSVEVRRVKWDVGLVQHDSFGIDVAATLNWLDQNVGDLLIDRIASHLADFDLCIVDINPMVMAACAQNGTPVVAVGNFSWSWIYSHFPPLAQWEQRFKAWEAQCDAIDISDGLGPGLSGFQSIVCAGRLVREGPSVEPIPNSVLLSFGGFGLRSPERLMPEGMGLHFMAGAATAAHPRLHGYPERPYEALIASAGVIVTKVGYGIVTEAVQHGVPLLCLSRSDFPEAPILEAWIRKRGDVVLDGPFNSPDFDVRYREALARVLSRPRPPRMVQNGAADICRLLGL